MRVSKQKAYTLAQKNVFKRAKMKDKADANYAKAIEKLRTAESKLTPEQLSEVQMVVEIPTGGVDVVNTAVFSEPVTV